MTKTQTSRQEIRDGHPDSWVAVNEGDLLIGRVTDIVDAWSDKRNNLKGGNYPLLTIGSIEEATGYDLKKVTELKVHCFGTVLFNEIMRKQPTVGERIRFIYRGQGEDKRGTGNPPELYSITVASKNAGARAYANIERTEAAASQPVALPLAPPPLTEAQQEIVIAAPNDDDIPF
jgi:hypothetical protein